MLSIPTVTTFEGELSPWTVHVIFLYFIDGELLPWTVRVTLLYFIEGELSPWTLRVTFLYLIQVSISIYFALIRSIGIMTRQI
jgi:hypothetical protein